MEHRRKKKLLLERLEDRLTPTTTGVPWPDPGHLTLSFVPDGTDIGGTPSDLFSLLNQTAPTAAWQTAILQALETWTSLVNINVGVVADGGQPAGTPGAVEGDARFGDIRISAKPLADTAVSTAAFFSYAGSTWSGDVQLGDTQSFGINGQGNLDLYTIALHELGHSLGVEDTWTDQSSAEYGYYMGPRTGLGPQDIADIESLYGVRQPDAFDAKKSNDTIATATSLGNLTSQIAFDADLTMPSDVDFYKITTPLSLGANTIHVQIQTQGYSLLTPTVSVFDASHHLVATDSSTSPLDGNVDVTVKGAMPLSTYYVEVSHATSAFAVGGYHANISYGGGGLLSVGQLLSTVNNVVDFGLNNVMQLATVLVPVIGAKTDQRFDYFYKANIGSSSDVDYYQVQAPPSNLYGTGWTMHTMVWSTDSNMLHPEIHFFDAKGNPLQVQILNNGDGDYTIQGGGTPGSIYYIEVEAWNPNGANNVGNYDLAVKFDTSAPVVMDLIDSQTLTATAPSTTGVLTMNQNQLYQFSLAAATLDDSEDAVVTMTVYDSNGNKVLTLSAVAGQPPVTQLVYLTTGNYSIVYTAQSLSGNLLPDVDFWLTGSDFTNPSGPYYVTPGGSPSGSGTGGTSSGGTTGSGSGSTGSGGSTTVSYTASKPSSGTTQPFYY